MAEADLRHVHARGRPTVQGMKKKGCSSGGPPEKVGGARPARDSVRKRARLGPFKPRRAGAHVNTAHARLGLSASEAPGSLSNRHSPSGPASLWFHHSPA